MTYEPLRDHKRQMPANATLEQQKGAQLNGMGLESFRKGIDLRAQADKLISQGIQFLEEATRLDPANASYPSNIGALMANVGRYTEALPHLLKATSLEPMWPEVHENMVAVLSSIGELEGCLAGCWNAVKLNPDRWYTHAGWIFYLDYWPETTWQEALEARRAFNQLFIQTLPQFSRFEGWNRDPHRVLRIGYCSGDFSSHSAALAFIGPIFAHTNQVELYGYSSTGPEKQGDATEVFKQRFKVWREVKGLSDDELAQQIWKDRIDILVDLSTFSKDTRLLAFARRPAPIQIAAWGCMTGSTGQDCIDWLITDSIVSRSDEWLERYTERIMEMPSIIPFAPAMPAEHPTEPTPWKSAGVFTFGSLNRTIKISNPVILETWAEILRAIPQSRLLLKDPSFDFVQVSDRFRREFSQRGIDPFRLELRGKTDRRQHMLANNEVDLALDPYPHGGGVTSMESLWMGCPVLTWRGDTVVSRLTTSFLTHVGLATEFSVPGRAEYVQRAVAWATQGRPRLAQIRHGLRDRVMNSAMTNHVQYAKDLEEGFRLAWHEWLQRTEGEAHR